MIITVVKSGFRSGFDYFCAMRAFTHSFISSLSLNLEWLDLASKNIGGPVKFKDQINTNDFFFFSISVSQLNLNFRWKKMLFQHKPFPHNIWDILTLKNYLSEIQN